MTNHIKINQNYYLITRKLVDKKDTPMTKHTNHLFIVDVSGSMYGEIERIKKQLKNNLSTVMNVGDTITIIFFSGRNDCGVLVEEIEVRSLTTLEHLHKAVDRLHSMGLTAFCPPLVKAKEVIERIKKNRPDSIFSLVFLTDGYNNDCPFESAISSLKALAPELAAACFVEYGYYADAQKLTQMASITGGEKISCDGFDEFEPVFNKKLSSALGGGKKTVVEITDPYLYDFAYSVTPDGSVLLYTINDGKIMVGGDVNEIYFFSPKAIGSENKPETALYAAVYVLADKLMNDDAEKLFYVLGDNFYYQVLQGAFGKQKLNAFKNAIKECVADAAKRYPAGVAAIQKVDENAYCLMNLIDDLGSIDGCLFYPSHPDFSYSRIGRKRVAVGSNFTDEQKQQLAAAANPTEAQALLEQFSKTNVDLKFVSKDPNAGYSMTDLVWNEERANLSIRIKIDGTIALPKNDYGVTSVDTYKYNTFTLIRDGIVNVKYLPVSYTDDLYQIVMDKHLNATIADGYIVLDLSSLPLVNKSMVKTISAQALAEQEWELLKLQGTKKVYDYYRKLLFPKESKSFIETYGQEAADWLKEIGITDYNGFSPKTEAEESTDFYMSVRLATKVKGVSSLPKVEDVLAKIKAGGSLKTGEWLLENALLEYTSQLTTPMYLSLNPELQTEMLKAYLINKTKELNIKKRRVMQELAQIKFALILSKKWFTEFKSFDENKMTLTLDGFNLDFTFDMTEKEEKI